MTRPNQPHKLILDLCGGTGSWSKPYKEAGYDVRVITLPEFDVTDEKVIQMCIDLKPYGVLCATPCECWGVMGNCRWGERTKEFIVKHTEILIKNLRIIYESNPVFWCIENPPGKMKRFLGEPKFQFCASEFGEPYTKKTNLWGKFNNPTKSDIRVPIIKDYIRKGKGAWDKKSEMRAITPSSFANAFFKENG